MPEACTGISNQCPENQFALEGTVCRAAAGPCDVTEVCTGTSAQCPPDQFQPSSFVCRPAVGACDVAETCPGNAAQCPDNQFKAAGTQCNDNNACTTNDQGNGAGFCIGTEVSGGTICGSVCCSDKTPYCCNGTCSNKAPVGVACKGGGNCCSGICTAAGICA